MTNTPSTGSMVERVARAISSEWEKDNFVSYAGSKEFTTHMEKVIRDRLYRQALAAIEAMREPTREMLDMGASAIDDAHDSTRDSYSEYTITSGSDYAYPGWTAMIDAALSEHKQGK
jgi:hypothetical protein